MSYIQAILMGLIQGLTEFLPVSSSGHITITSALYKVFTGNDFLSHSNQEIIFDMILHLGTMIAIIIYFRNEIYSIIKAFFHALKNKDFSSIEAKLSLYIILGTICTVIVAYPLKDISKKLVFSPAIVGGMLIVTAFILFLSEYVSKKIKIKTNEVDIKTAILIGIAQGLAAFPGISRSGTTISVGLMCGLDRVKCARYSFLLSLPIILCASIFYPILEVDMHDLISYDWCPIFIGFLFSIVSGYLCIKYFLAFLNRYSMKCFAFYCLFIGILSIILFNFVFN